MIPHTIHQIWLGPHAAPSRAMRTWRARHPEWEFFYWTEGNLPDLVNQPLFDAYYKAKNWRGCSDVLRMEVVYRYGGWYFDGDFICLQPIDSLCEHVCAFGSEHAKRDVVINGAFGAEPGALFLKHCIDRMKGIRKARLNPYQDTGPQMVTNLARSFPHLVDILDPVTFMPLTTEQCREGRLDLIDNRAYAVHFFMSWSDLNNLYSKLLYGSPP